MPHYMIQGGYTVEAVAHLVNHPQDRSAMARTLIDKAGGRLQEFYLTFGHDDFLVIAELPNDAAIAAVALALGATGVVHGVHTTKLLTVNEAMDAMHKAQSVLASFQPPN